MSQHSDSESVASSLASSVSSINLSDDPQDLQADFDILAKLTINSIMDKTKLERHAIYTSVSLNVTPSNDTCHLCINDSMETLLTARKKILSAIDNRKDLLLKKITECQRFANRPMMVDIRAHAKEKLIRGMSLLPTNDPDSRIISVEITDVMLVWSKTVDDGARDEFKLGDHE